MFSFIGCDDNGIASQSADEVLDNEGYLSKGTVKSFTRISYNAYGREQLMTEESQSHFNTVQPPIKLEWSLERDNLNRRNLLWNDPNKVSYIYLWSEMGTCLGFFSIKGKVSSVNSKLTTSAQLVDEWYSSASGTVESPAMDGSYGSNGDAIFFFTTNGIYVEHNGAYTLVDAPLTLNVEPMFTMEVQQQ